MICPACSFDTDAVVEETFHIKLNHGAQSLNVVGVNSKNNRAYRGARRKWERLLRNHAVPAAEKKRRVFFTRHWGKGKRAFDYGNLVGGFKPLLDMVVKADILLDDSPSCCSEYYSQCKSGTGADYVTIIIQDYEIT